MKQIETQKKWISVVVAVVIAMILSAGIAHRHQMLVNAKIAIVQKRLAKETFRFHVLANSDSEEDQKLKLKVKGAVIKYMREDLPHSTGVAMTKRWANHHIQEIEQVAYAVIAQEGYEYPVKVMVTKSQFPDKTYGDVTFPAGEYEALRIVIGEGEGHNWWCVLYPNLCFIDAVHAVVPEEGKEELKEVLDEEAYDMVTATTRFKIKWFFFPG